MLSSTFCDETDYHDLGGRYLADRDKEHVKQRLLRRLHVDDVEDHRDVHAVRGGARLHEVELRLGAVDDHPVGRNATTSAH